MLHVSDALHEEAVVMLLLLQRLLELANGSGDCDGTGRPSIQIPHRHAVILAAVPTVDEDTLSDPLPKFLVRERDVVVLVRLLYRVRKGLRERAFELVGELVASTKEQRLILEEIGKLRSIKIAPQDVLRSKSGADPDLAGFKYVAGRRNSSSQGPPRLRVDTSTSGSRTNSWSASPKSYPISISGNLATRPRVEPQKQSSPPIRLPVCTSNKAMGATLGATQPTPSIHIKHWRGFQSNV